MAEVKKSFGLRAAYEALTLGNPAEAVRLCKQALKQDRQSYDAFVLLGKALFATDNLDQADASYRRATDINPNNSKAWQGLAEVHKVTGDFTKLVEACESVIALSKGATGITLLADYTRRLATAYASISNHKKVGETWQAVLEIQGIPEALRLEALCGVVDAEVLVMESFMHDNSGKNLLPEGKAQAKTKIQKVGDWASSNEGKLMEVNLREILCQLPEATNYEIILLQLLLYQMQSASACQGQEWYELRFQVLQHSLNILRFRSSNLAFEILFALCEEDDSEDLFRTIGFPQNAQSREDRIAWLGKYYSHLYPDHPHPMSALAFAMYNWHSKSSSIESQRSYCERAVRSAEKNITGWEVLAELKIAEGAYTRVFECVDRGLDVISYFQSSCGLLLQSAELRLRLLSAKSLLNTGVVEQAEKVFQQVLQAAEGIQSRDRTCILVTSLEGLVKIALAQGNAELGSTRLSSLLVMDPGNSWALAKQGWLSFEKGNLEEALTLTERALSAKPTSAELHHQLGLLYWDTVEGDEARMEKAASHFLESARLDPSNAETFCYLGHHYRRVSGGRRRSIRCYQKSVALRPENEAAGEALCDLLEEGDEEMLALTICKEASNISPRAFWAWRHLGYLQVHRKEWKDAVTSLQHAIRGYPKCGEVWEALGLAYQELGRFTAALKAYGCVLTLGNSCVTFALQQSGTIQLWLGSYNKAIGMFELVLESVPDDLVAQCGLASALLGQAKKCVSMGAFGWSAQLLKQAADLMTICSKKNGNIASVWKLLGDVEMLYARYLPWEDIHRVSKVIEEGDREAFASSLEMWHKQRLLAAKMASLAYQHALHLQPYQSNLYGDLCLSLKLVASMNKHNSGKTTMPVAERVAYSGIRLEGSNADLWTALGAVATHDGISQHALIQALRIDADHSIAWACLGSIYFKVNRVDPACEAFERARIADPSLGITWAGMSAIHSLMKRNDLKEAFASCHYAVQMSPRAEFRLGLGKIAAYTNQLNSSQVYAAVEQAVLEAPDHAEAHHLKGLCCEARGQLQTAITAYEFARMSLELLSESNISHRRHAITINLARTLCKAGQWKAAVAEYEALAISGDLEGNSSGLRGYAVSLWHLGKRDLALPAARKAMREADSPTAASAAIVLILKLLFNADGPEAAFSEIKTAKQSWFLDPSVALTFFSIASFCGMKELLIQSISNYGFHFKHDTAIELFNLAANGIQISCGASGSLDYSGSIQFLKKSLHMHPHSAILRTSLLHKLLQGSHGRDVNLASRCCHWNSFEGVRSSEAALALGALGVACSACGGVNTKFTFSSCNTLSSNTIRDLQRRMHMQPGNLMIQYHLVLNLLQHTIGQRFPIHLCRVVKSFATSVLSSVLSVVRNDTALWEYVRFQLMLCLSEVSLHSGDCKLAIDTSRMVTSLSIPSDCRCIGHLQLARCYASQGDISTMRIETVKCQELASPSNHHLPLLGLNILNMVYGQVPNSLPDIDFSMLADPSEDLKPWRAFTLFQNSEMWLQVNHLLKAERAAAEACYLMPNEAAFYLQHGAICMKLAKSEPSSQYSSAAVQSLSTVLASNQQRLPIVSYLLAQAENGKSGLLLRRWEKNIRAELDIWASDCMPAEIYFQISLLTKQSGNSYRSCSDTPSESLRSSRSWLQSGIHLNPSCAPSWWRRMLRQAECNGPPPHL